MKIAFVFMMVLLLFVACQPSTSGYRCANGICVPITDNAEYSTLELCQSDCAIRGYRCEGGQCVEVELDSADFQIWQECLDSCQ